MKSSILTAAKVLWDYHCIYDPLEGADIIIGLGSYDPRVAERASDLYLEGLAPWLIFTGRSGRGTDKLYKASEAEAFAEIAIRRGVPERAIIIEPNATNIGENIRFRAKNWRGTRSAAFFVTKPQTQRRVHATVLRQWPEARASISAPLVSFEEQPTAEFPLEMLIHEMTGDLQRILEYPAKGYQIAQAVPLEVMEAYDFLIEQGFDGHPVR
ncbi:hypothetical protein V568_102289 [Brucella ceti TE28753-12]|nr:YdcF family protein [Brucella ceti]AHB02810.1 hypothetical protein V568_102289 [Brucella ceti TE28753-12]